MNNYVKILTWFLNSQNISKKPYACIHTLHKTHHILLFQALHLLLYQDKISTDRPSILKLDHSQPPLWSSLDTGIPFHLLGRHDIYCFILFLNFLDHRLVACLGHSKIFAFGRCSRFSWVQIAFCLRNICDSIGTYNWCRSIRTLISQFLSNCSCCS